MSSQAARVPRLAINAGQLAIALTMLATPRPVRAVEEFDARQARAMAMLEMPIDSLRAIVETPREDGSFVEVASAVAYLRLGLSLPALQRKFPGIHLETTMHSESRGYAPAGSQYSGPTGYMDGESVEFRIISQAEFDRRMLLSSRSWRSDFPMQTISLGYLPATIQCSQPFVDMLTELSISYTDSDLAEMATAGCTLLRREAVKLLRDPELLDRLATTDPDSLVSAASRERFGLLKADQDSIYRYICSAKHDPVQRAEAVALLTDETLLRMNPDPWGSSDPWDSSKWLAGILSPSSQPAMIMRGQWLYISQCTDYLVANELCQATELADVRRTTDQDELWSHLEYTPYPMVQMEVLKRYDKQDWIKLIAEGGRDFGVDAGGHYGLAVRLAAVERLSDPKILEKLVQDARDTDDGPELSVSLAALDRIDDPKTLKRISRECRWGRIEMVIVAKLTDQEGLRDIAELDDWHGYIAPEYKDWINDLTESRTAAVAKITDEEILTDLARHAKHQEVQLAAIRKLRERKPLEELASREPGPIKDAALKRLQEIK
jgi:hypothetical protein